MRSSFLIRLARACRFAALVISVIAATAASAGEDTQVYIVRLVEPPAIEAAATGRIRHQAGRRGRVDARAAPVQSYAAELTAEHERLLAKVGASDAKLYSYRLAFNGFAARLTRAQVAQLAADPAVAEITPDRSRKLRSNASAGFLGLTDPTEGLQGELGLDGEGIIIGIIDSGITPEHPSFADRIEKKKPRVCRSEWASTSLLGRWLCARFRESRYTSLYEPPRGWHGHCQSGERFARSACSNKLIGARYYAEGFLSLYEMDPNEFMSARDADGHGTHIASVAAGHAVRATLGGTEVATIRGIAPRARIAVYKACWLERRYDEDDLPIHATRATCAMSDLQAAIEDAIADGVDIINYAVGTTEGGPLDADAQALLNASDAGVLAVVAAGNAGPAPGTIESPGSAPWVLSVAASSRSGPRYAEVVQMSVPGAPSADLIAQEAGFTRPLREGPVSGRLQAAADGTAPAGDACQALTDPDQVRGRILLVARGTCTFQEKIARAAAAGATAVIVYNTSGPPIIMTGERGSVSIPAVMIGSMDGEALLARLTAGEAVQVRLQKGLVATRNETGNLIYGPSSRGPNPITWDILKPDVTAPGTNILGAQTPDVANGVQGERFQYLSGTSMAVPQVAGAAALLKQAHPDWSAAALRSALVTTARQDVYKEDGERTADPFDFGGGHIAPNRAVDPGLVYDAGREEYDAWACGAGIPRISEEECAALADAGYPTAIDELNVPTLALSGLVGERTIRRRVTNVGAPATWQAAVETPDGVTLSVVPDSLTLATGETGEFSVTFSNLGDPDVLGGFSFGALVWSNGNQTARSPIAVHTAPLANPTDVGASGASGTTTFEIQFGYAGPFEVSALGLAAPLGFSGTVLDDPLGIYTILEEDAALPDHIRRVRVAVPEGTRYLRVALAGADEGATDDLDLYLLCPDALCPDGNEGLASTEDAAEELIDILDPYPGEYVIDVHGYETDEITGGPGANFTLRVWMIGAMPELGAVTASAPPLASVGASGEVTVSWADLEPGDVYLGLISHRGAGRELGQTVVEIVSP